MLLITEFIIQGCIANDRKCIRALYDACYPVLMKASKRYTEDKEAALDILNQSFMKILQGLDKLQNIEAIYGWAKQIAVRTSIDELRKNKLHNERNKFILDRDDECGTYNIESHDFTESKLEVNAIFELIGELPFLQKQVLNLVSIDGFSHKEAGEFLDVTEDYSRQLLNKARKAMTQKIAERNKNFKYS
jgi:RNA polymerase sigma factor (sigma-70 family)